MNEGEPLWPRAVRMLHWLAAILVLGLLVLGVFMVQAIDDAAQRFELTQAHKSFGIAVLALTVVRLFVRAVTVRPPAEPAAPLVLVAGRLAHVALYALLVALPLSGWLMVSTTPVRVPTTVFGLFNLPYFLPVDLATYRIAHAIHVVLAITLGLLVAVHVAAAFFHAFIWRHRIFARMWVAKSLPR
jgi:cytochrome b561